MVWPALFDVMGSALFTPAASISERLNASIFGSNVPKLDLFLAQLGDLDTGLGNEIWFLIIIAVVAIFMYFVYRGPKHM
jgi:hypothetical protein